MSTITESRVNLGMPEPVVLHGVTYGEYVRLRDDRHNKHLRMVYHDGVLEVMSPESTHEMTSRQIGIFIYVLCVELRIECVGARSTTFRRGDTELKKGKGREPDESFYFANANLILGKNPIDLERDPPPDLWIELDHRASSRGKLPLYAALGVPEVCAFEVGRNTMWFGIWLTAVSMKKSIIASACPCSHRS